MRWPKSGWAPLTFPAWLLLVGLAPDTLAQCQRAKLVNEEGQTEDTFGFCVAVSADVVMIGAPRDDDGGDNFGSVFVYERVGPAAEWPQVAQLPPEGSEILAGFGWSLSIDADSAVIGVRGPQEAYAFERIAGQWLEGAQLIADDWWFECLFGESVGLSETFALVGAPHDDDNGFRSGSAQVFQRDPNGNWLETAKLLPDDGGVFWAFGTSVSVSADRVLVGADGAEVGALRRRPGRAVGIGIRFCARAGWHLVRGRQAGRRRRHGG